MNSAMNLLSTAVDTRRTHGDVRIEHGSRAVDVDVEVWTATSRIALSRVCGFLNDPTMKSAASSDSSP